MELPECPVCLQTYDGDFTIPRVLSCGHTTCQNCLNHLPRKFPLAVRCPACTQVVKLPPGGGPSALPKNIDLLRLITTNTQDPKPHKLSVNDDSILDRNHLFFPDRQIWSDQLYSEWKTWVLPPDAVSTTTMTALKDGGDRRQRIELFEVGSLTNDDDSCQDSVLKFGYWAKVLKCLADMREEQIQELLVVFRACSNAKRLCKVFGLWGDLESASLFIVFEKLSEMPILDFDGLPKGGLFSFGLIAMEICEAVISLNKEGLIAGCLGLSCFKFDEFGHAYVDLSEILLMGRGIRNHLAEGGRRTEDEEIRVLVSHLRKSGMFASPEALFEVLKKNGAEVVQLGGYSKYSLGNGSDDVWSLACILLSLLFPKQFDEETIKVEFLPLQKIICRCLNSDPESRPLVTDVWKCIREMVIVPQFDIAIKVNDVEVSEESKGRCLIQLELLETKVIDNVEEASSEKDLVDGLSEGNFKWKDLEGHLDCITGLAVGGGFLFGSSYAKTIHVWSLVDFSHVQTFRGHEHKVMDVIFVEEEEPLCVSADGGGGIFVWSTRNPLSQEPLKKWNEQKDWRFSGIHSLTAGGNGCIYTGSGDKTIKAWSLKDGTLLCTMMGHRSTVSTLAVCNGVLYSGSWDGTIRLWTLSDHSLLTVLGEGTPGNLSAVLSIAADQQVLVASHENGTVEVWKDDSLIKSTRDHSGAVFTVSIEGKWLFTGGWDKTINVQEFLNGDNNLQLDSIPVGSIPCNAVVTTMLCWQGKLFVGFGDRTFKSLIFSATVSKQRNACQEEIGDEEDEHEVAYTRA
ncbi:uncharacterized protein [Rutidosis leptorrhynchoides]|uniref:uncharacterized protein n=1 Tax=Rutidosis leptorrhynchoides TaxID=125765 RepID=UPI003A99027D